MPIPLQLTDHQQAQNASTYLFTYILEAKRKKISCTAHNIISHTGEDGAIKLKEKKTRITHNHKYLFSSCFK